MQKTQKVESQGQLVNVGIFAMSAICGADSSYHVRQTLRGQRCRRAPARCIDVHVWDNPQVSTQVNETWTWRRRAAQQPGWHQQIQLVRVNLGGSEDIGGIRVLINIVAGRPPQARRGS